MKRLLILSAIIVASVQLNASHLASELNLRLQHQAWFTVTLDHQFYETPVNFFHTGALTPGHHFLQVTRLDHGYYGPYTQPRVIYSGNITIPARSKVHAFIDNHGQLRINKITALGPVYAPAPVIHPYAPAPVQYGMSIYEFDQLKNTISNLSFESSRLQVAKQALSANNVTSYQVAELVRMMTFESSKLDLAKFAFHRTVDKQNYYILNDAFSFESSIMDLNDFIYRT
ncbi:MAG: DUF4476 domain-containing protein [Bacteroidota bacterium]|nr:DUF4476 domain-containing protein [Bacteroidota bacterium]